MSPEGGAPGSIQRKDLTGGSDVGSVNTFLGCQKKKTALVDVDMSFFLKYLTVFSGKKDFIPASPLLVMLKAGCLYVFLSVEIPTIRIGFFVRALKFPNGYDSSNLIRIWKPSIIKVCTATAPQSLLVHPP